MSRPGISVITPCHKLGQYIDEAVDSVLAQTYQDFEIVIVRDGSTDGDTKRLLADYKRQECPEFKPLRSPDRGWTSANTW